MASFPKFIPAFLVLGLALAGKPAATRADDGTTASTPLATPTSALSPVLPASTNVLPKSWTGQKIYAFDTLFGTKGSGLNQLNGPEGICVGPDGNLYIADTQNSRILEWTCDGKPIKTIGSYGPSAIWRNEPEFDHPAGVLVVPDGQIYVADTQNNRIVLLDPNGLVNLSWGRLGTRRRQFTAPRVVAKDHFGNIWVLDSGNSRVSNFSNMGKFNFTWGSFGTQPGSLNFPLGMALNNIDQGILTDTGNFRIEVFNDQSPPSAMDQSPVTTDSGGTTVEPPPVNYSPVTVEGWYGDGPGQFKEPAGVVVTKSRMIVVADGMAGRVDIFNHRFDFIGEWRAADENLNLASPPRFRGVASDSMNRLYITDIQNNCIIRLKPINPDVPQDSAESTPIPTETPVPPTPTPTPDDSSPFGGGFPIR